MLPVLLKRTIVFTELMYQLTTFYAKDLYHAEFAFNFYHFVYSDNIIQMIIIDRKYIQNII